MVRAATRRSARRPELRRALVAQAHRLEESFPYAGGDALKEHTASLKSGPIVLTTSSMFQATYHGVGPWAAEPYVYRSDPDDVRRWLLDEDDFLTELEPAPCASSLCQCSEAEMRSRGWANV